MRKRGFTLIEILVVIGVIAAVIALVIPNFMGIRQRARDTKRKTELGEVKTALRLYYNDYQAYPVSTAVDPYIRGCGANGTTQCPVCATFEFAAGGATGCNITYMKYLPDMNGTVAARGWFYYSAGGDDFCLAAQLENNGDLDATTQQTRCASACGVNCTWASGSAPKYCLCAD